MQSGIAASTELHNAFQGFVADPSLRGLLAGISSAPESLEPRGTVSASTGDFLSDLANLVPLLKDDEALYIILRQTTDDSLTSGSGALFAITYVPDHAPVRQKMLFASTRLSLVRELGIEHFRSSLLVTDKEELSKQGWLKHETHNLNDAPLTEEEQSLKGIREAEAQESTGTGARRAHVSSGVQLPITDEASSALNRFASHDLDLLQLHINVQTETIDSTAVNAGRATSLSALPNVISNTRPQYTFFRITESSDRSKGVIFIYSCPASSSIKEKMLCASSRGRILALAKSEAEIVPEQSIEISDPHDLTEANGLSDLGAERSKVEVGNAKRFDRPKRPGRR